MNVLMNISPDTAGYRTSAVLASLGAAVIMLVGLTSALFVKKKDKEDHK